MTGNLQKDKDKESGFSRVKVVLLSCVLSCASLTLIKQLSSLGDVNCDHQIKVSSGDQRREETSAGLYEPWGSNGACPQTSAIMHARTRARLRCERASEPVNESTVLAQTEQTFPHVLKMRGSIRSATPRFGLETLANG